MHKVTTELYESIKDVVDMDFIFSYVPLPAVVANQSMARGGDMMGLDRDPKDRICKSQKALQFDGSWHLATAVFFSPRWIDKRYDERMYEAARTWVNRVLAVALRFGTDDEFLYHNFAGGFQDPLTTYGPDNLRFMRSVARKYDRDGFFQVQMPGGFKLGDKTDFKFGLHVQS
jgi:hypothetical protein